MINDFDEENTFIESPTDMVRTGVGSDPRTGEESTLLSDKVVLASFSTFLFLAFLQAVF